MSPDLEEPSLLDEISAMLNSAYDSLNKSSRRLLKLAEFSDRGIHAYLQKGFPGKIYLEKGDPTNRSAEGNYSPQELAKKYPKEIESIHENLVKICDHPECFSPGRPDSTYLVEGED